MKQHCIILGAGWSGLSAALHLSHQRPNFPILLLEATAQAGGRARSLPKTLQGSDSVLDNGQHIVLNSCTSLLRLYQILNVNTDAIFLKKPLEFWVENQPFFSLGFSFASHLYHLLKFKHWLKKQCLTSEDLTVSEWLQKHQPPSFIEQFWEPVAQALMTTPIHQASTTLFAHTLQTCLNTKKLELWLPQQDLNQIFPNLALNYLTKHNKNFKVLYHQRAIKVDLNHGPSHSEQPHVVHTKTNRFKAPVLINALPFQTTQKLYPILKLPDFAFEPITTIYLHYNQPIALKYPMQHLQHRSLPWVFDRAFAHQPNLLAWVYNGFKEQAPIPEVLNVLSRVYPHLKPENCLHHKIITEKTGAFQASPAQNKLRPTVKTTLSNFFLAGEYTRNNFPTSLEGAALSGQQAAELVLGQ